jgi:hypothetical protein
MKKLLSVLILAVFVSSSMSFAQTKETRNVGTFTKISFRVPGKLYLRQGSPQKVEIEGKKDILEEIDIEVSGGKLVIEREGKWGWNWNWGASDAVTVYITVKDIEALSVGGSGDLIGETKITARDLDLNVSGSGNMKVEIDASGDVEADVSGSGDLFVKGRCSDLESDVSGSGKVVLEMNIASTADFGISGSGKIEARGTSSAVKASISGSGKVYAADLETNRCDIRISGSGDIEINVKQELDATISGSGTVSYRGNPSKVSSHSSGSGRVRKM